MMKITGLPADKAKEYIALLSKIESNDNPNAKAKTSTASGRFQFIKSTWTGLGYDWADVFNDELQYEAAERFTDQNAEGLRKAGCAINFATLYGAHFLGLAGFLKIMRATPATPITQVTTAAQRKANPTILKGTVQDFCDWLQRKTGDHYTKRYNAAPVVEAPSGGPKKSGGLGAAIFVVIVFAIAAAIAVLTKGGLGG